MNRPYHAGVIGAGRCNNDVYEIARELGSKIGEMGWTLICGGLGGVMEGAAKGCSEAGGTTVGILPGLDRESANPFIKVPIPTGLGEGRNLLVVRASDILFAVSGGYGTLSEIALALKTGKPVIGLETWQTIDGIHVATDYENAVEMARGLLRDHNSSGTG